MARIPASVLEPAIRASDDPFAVELLARLRRESDGPLRAKATRPFSRRAALAIYRRKAAKGDRPWVRTDGYPALLAVLGAAPDEQVVVHGVTFADVVYLVFTDPAREQCLAVLRKQRVGPAAGHDPARTD